jgi:hypothetical protein
MATYQEFLKDLREMKSQNIGLMSESQYMNIGYLISALGPINLLVFGLGGDAYLWDKLNSQGKTYFLEDDIEWIEKFKESNLDIFDVKYDTFVGDHETINFDAEKLTMKLPEEVKNTKWDMIIVDAPLGHGPPGRPYKGPGRMQSIFTANQLLKDGGICIVDDVKRHVEQKYAFHYFGEENLLNIIEGKVAIFKKRSNDLKTLLEGKNVALVGPASYMMGSGLGKEIDKHDVVVRINRGIESISVFENDLGKRTDIYYSCLIERAQQTGTLNPDDLKHKYKIKHIVAPPDSNMKGYAHSTKLHSLVDRQKVKKIQELLPVTIVDHKFHTGLAEKVDCKPNTGFMAIYDLLRYNPKKLSIYGFSFYLDGFIDGQKSGVEKEKQCTEQEFADMAFRSKRHVQKNMWEYAKETLLENSNVKLDPCLQRILEMKDFSREEFKSNVAIYSN